MLTILCAWIKTSNAQWGTECLSDLAKNPYQIRGKAKISIHVGLVLKSIPFTTNCLNNLHIGISIVTMRREYKIGRETIMDLVLSYLSRFCLCSLAATAAAAKSLQSCPTLCDPIDSSPPGSPVPGILQARTPNAWKGKGKVKSLSRIQLLATPWTAAHQAPPSMGFSRQEYPSGVAIAFSGGTNY